jgi:phosphoribosylformimino-5-aminoimidazole carboxamide ribotide isomerase
MKIIPAIDIIDGKCVRLSKGNYATKKIYNEHPLEVAKEFENAGIKYLHLVDLDGAKSKRIVNQKVLELLAKNTSLEIDFGGGLKSDEDLKIAFDSGASKITGGSIAVKNPETFLGWLKQFGADKIILGADCLNGKIMTDGWLESSDNEIITFIEYYQKEGVRSTICTDVSKDGMLQGPSFELYTEILAKTNIELIASGGISNFQDVLDLKKQGCSGAIIGKAIYEGKVTLKQLSELC